MTSTYYKLFDDLLTKSCCCCSTAQQKHLAASGASEWIRIAPGSLHAELARARIATLSFGQRRKLALAAALCGQPRVLLPST